MKYPFLLLVLLIFLPNGGQAAPASPALTLDEVLREVRVGNPAIAAARERAAALRERVPQERAWEDPAFVYEGNVAGEADQSVKLQQTLPLSGRNLSRGRVAQAEAAGGVQAARMVELEALREARIAYFQFVAAGGLLDLNTRTGEILGAIAEAARTRFEAGNETQEQLLTAESERAKNSEERVDLDRSRSEAQSALNRLMHRPADAPLSPAGVPLSGASMLHLDLAAMQARALEHSPEIRSARARIAAARAKVELAKRQWIPDPSAAIKGRRFVDRGERMSEATVEISFNLPWANRAKYSAGVREAGANLAATQADYFAAKDSVLARVRDGVRKAEAFSHHIELFREKIIPLSREAFESARLGYETGKTALPEVFNAQKRLRDDEAEALRHGLDLQMALAELDALTGTHGTPDL